MAPSNNSCLAFLTSLPLPLRKSHAPACSPLHGFKHTNMPLLCFNPERMTSETRSSPLTKSITPSTPPTQSPPSTSKKAKGLFNKGASVDYWRSNSMTSSIREHDFSSILQEITTDIRASPVNASYWLFSLRRHLFFSLFKNASVTIFSRLGNESLPMIVLSPFLTSLLFCLHVFRQDLYNINKGLYNLPWNYSAVHRESSFVHTLSEMFRSAYEGQAIISRVVRKQTAIKTWLKGPMYHNYYSRSYHFQTDGWLSSQSAAVYDFNTEAIFVGVQDSMQRLALLGVRETLLKLSKKERNPAIVEIGCGTGRFGTYLRDNYPKIDLTLSDASPFYLQQARENMRYYEKFSPMTRAKARRGTVRYVQAIAEDLPMTDSSVDVVIAQYLFHELPPQVRRDVVMEAGRVLRRGGVFVLNDSLQKEDDSGFPDAFEQFEDFDEPWYATYYVEDFGDMFLQTGMFEVGKMEICGATKMMSFTRI